MGEFEKFSGIPEKYAECTLENLLGMLVDDGYDLEITARNSGSKFIIKYRHNSRFADSTENQKG